MRRQSEPDSDRQPFWTVLAEIAAIIGIFGTGYVLLWLAWAITEPLPV